MGHGQWKHSKTKHKKHSRTQKLKKKKKRPLVKNKSIDKNKNAKDWFPHFSTLQSIRWGLRWHLLLSKVFKEEEKPKKNPAH